MMSKSTFNFTIGKVFPVFTFLVLLNLLPVQKMFAQPDCGVNCDMGNEVPCASVILPAVAGVNIPVFLDGDGNCCSEVPAGANCVELFITVPENLSGVTMEPIFPDFYPWPEYDSLQYYDATLQCGAYDGPYNIDEPFCFTTPPLDGVARFLICSEEETDRDGPFPPFTPDIPGNIFDPLFMLVTGVGDPSVTSPETNSDPACGSQLLITGVPSDVTVTWDSPQDNGYIDCLSFNCQTAEFTYPVNPGDPAITDCDGVDFVYEIDVPANECEPAQTLVSTITVYPPTTGNFTAACMNGAVEYTYTPDVSCSDLTFIFMDNMSNILQSGSNNTYIDLTPIDGLTEIIVEVSRAAAVDCAPTVASVFGTCCEAPVFTDCPADYEVVTSFANCLAVVFPTPNATGVGCAPVTVAQITGPVSGSDFVLGVPTLIEFEATNAINQSTICSFNITLTLDSDFSLACPADVLTCNDNGVSWTGMNLSPIYAPDCGMPSDLVLEYEVSGATTIPTTVGNANGVAFNIGQNTLTYKLYLMSNPDDFEECSVDIRVTSCLPPVITCPEDMTTVQCGTEDVDAWIATAMGIDPDDLQVVTLSNELLVSVAGCGNTYVNTYEFTATNELGQFSTCVASYGIIDTEVPTIDTEAENMLVECDGASNAAEIIAWLNNNGGATASDNCSTLTWSNNYGDITNTCGASGSVEVTFTATDECGNANSSTATFTINDNTPPTWEILPQDITIECGVGMNVDLELQEWLDGAGGADAEDECSFVVFSNTDPVFSDECGTTGSATVTFTATDGCGNAVMADATVTIQDNFGPELATLAIDEVVECDGSGNTAALDAWLLNNGGATATDNCSDPVVWSSTLVNTTENCGGSSVATYNFQATDACDNTSAASQASFIIIDSTNPEITTNPSSTTVECDGSGNIAELSAWLDNHGGAVASDVCSDGLNWGFVLSGDQDNCGLTGVNTYTFFVFDACGNSATASADFTIEDTTDPEITAEAMNFNTECDGSNNSVEILGWLNNNGGAEADDSCGDITWSNDYGSITSECGSTGSVTVTFTATDACGNSSMTSAEFSIDDSTSPSWEITPANLTIECDGSADPMGQIAAWLQNIGGGEAEDDCSLVVYANDFTALNAGCNAGSGSALVTFTATDACGNSSMESATVTVEDSTPPGIVTSASNLTVECDGSGNNVELDAWLSINGGAVASDACGGITWNTPVLLNTVNGCGGTSEAIYLFSATDDCGNVSNNTTASFFIEDNTAPVIDPMAMNMTVECDGNGNDDALNAWLNNIANAGATDICSDNLTWSWDLVGDEDACGTTGSQDFTFTVEDECGNSSSTTGSFTIEDTAVPVVTGGADYVGDCDDNGSNNDDEFVSWLLSNAGASASDVCGGVNWTNDYHVDNWEYFCGDSKTITVSFTVTDDCGNNTSISHDFSIGDVEVPIFENCPRPSVIVDTPEGWCSAYANFSAPSATDNCGDVTINQIDGTGLGSGDLFPLGLTVLIYEAVDACGNKDTCSFKVIVNDYHLDPSLDCPSDVTMNNDPFTCGAAVYDIAPQNVTDNCPDNLAIIYTVTDDAGNILDCGVEDASGYEFPVGSSNVTYNIQDQPLLLITEVYQSGTDAVELTNFGPASLDITCLLIERLGTGSESHVVPLGTVLGIGDTYVYNFNTNVSTGAGAGYQISLEGTVFDAVAVNGYVPAGVWSGSLDSGDVWRNRICDNDNAADWTIASECEDSSVGVLNPGLPTMTDNGTQTALQSELANEASCSFNVLVIDSELPSCAEHNLIISNGPSSSIDGPSCVTSSVNIGGSAIVGQINILGLNIAYPDMGDITASLTGPNGTSVELFSGLCEETGNANVNLSDTTSQSILDASCSPLGNGWYIPSEALKAFYGSDAQGQWTLSLSVDGNSNGVLNGWTLHIYELNPYSQGDEVLNNEPGLCGANFDWTHPVLQDNCCEGTITVVYLSDDAETVPSGGFVNGGTDASEYFAVGTTTVKYTLVDAAGLTNMCSFDVTVLDVEDPIINQCLSNMAISLDAGECCMVINFPDPYVSDNCEVTSIVFDPPSGSEFCIGLHNVEITVYDEAGNTATCDFEIEVSEYIVQEPFNFACNDLIYLSLGADCQATIDADMLLEGSNYGCYDNYCITIEDVDGNIIPGNVLTQEHVGQYFNVSVGDCFEGGSSCWGQVFLENKLVPEIECPADVTVACNDPYDTNATGVVILLSCEVDYETTYSDQLTDYGDCGNPRAQILRTWLVTDDSGNTASCEQIITVVPFDLNQVEFPVDLTYVNGTALSCDDVANNPSLLDPDYTGEPNIDGISLFGDHFCEVNIGYWDETLYDANCVGAYEILRHWIVRDECQPLVEGVNPLKHIQAIKVDDNEAPNLETFQDITISTDVWGCGATYVIPYIFIDDNCTPTENIDVSYSVIGGSIIQDVLYIQEPAVGKTVELTVWAVDQCGNADNVSFNITVIDNLAPNLVADAHTVVSLNPQGEAFAYAHDLDDGSSDGCGPIGFFARRLNTTCPGYEEEDDFNKWFDKVHFCCEDIQYDAQGEAIPVMVQFRVCDDGNGDGTIGNGGDNCSLAMIEVEVQDKLIPQIECPDDATIECKVFQSIGNPKDLTDAELDLLFGPASALSSCGNIYNQFLTNTDICGTGTMLRYISVTTAGGTSTCVQKIHVIADFDHQFSCDKIYFENYPESNYKWCLSASNGGPVDNFGAIQINSGACGDFTPQQVTIDFQDLCAIPYVNMTIDTFEFAGGGCFKYLVHWEVIDECVFNENFVDPVTGETNPFHTDNGYYHIYVEYDVFDADGPVLDCKDYIIPCDELGLDQITMDGYDECTPDAYLSWYWKVDLNNDFSIEGEGQGQTATGPFPIGTHRIIWTVSDGCGNTTTENCVFSIGHEDLKSPTPVCHDGLSTAVMQQPACYVEAWAEDFDASSYDDCDQDLEFTIIPESDAANSSNPYADSKTSWVFDCSYIENGVTGEIEVRMYATDNTGKYDYCVASLRIDDHFDCCEDSEDMNLIVAGKVATEEGEGVEDVAVELKTSNPEYPIEDITGSDGTYAFIFNPYFYNYILSSDNDKDYLNGVTTLDLVMIQKHILSYDPLESPYKKIAADVNSDCNITALDLLQLRKLILGIYPDSELPDNDSWRFVDETFEFSDPNIFCGFDENLNLDLLAQDELDMDFIGVKVGDVNGSAAVNATSEAENRENEVVKFIVNEIDAAAGTTQKVDFYAADFDQVSGFQFTLNIDVTTARFNNLISGKLSITESNLGLSRVDEGIIGISWHDVNKVSANDQEVLFTLEVEMLEDANTADLLQVNSRTVKAEIYKTNALLISDLGLDIRSNDGVFEQLSYELYQNEPNPFDKQTAIGFQLPEDGKVHIQLIDATGKTLKLVEGDFSKGYNEIIIEKTEINAAGVIYYKLSSGSFTATRKMIVLN